MVNTDTFRLSLVEGEGFRKTMAFVEPEYKPSSQQTTAMRVENVYNDSRAEVKADLQHGEKVAVLRDF